MPLDRAVGVRPRPTTPISATASGGPRSSSSPTAAGPRSSATATTTTGTRQSGIFILDLKTGAVIRKLMTGVGSVATPNGIGSVVRRRLRRRRHRRHRLCGRSDRQALEVRPLRSEPGELEHRVRRHAAVPRARQRQRSAHHDGAGDHGASDGGLLAVLRVGPIYRRERSHEHASSKRCTAFGTKATAICSGPISCSSRSRVSLRWAATTTARVTSNTIDWASKHGWYMDLPTSGERVAVDPIMRDGRIVFTTLIPDSSPVHAGGTGWLMELDFKNGGQLPLRRSTRTTTAP